MKQIDHRPEMASFFDVNLKNISQVIEGRAGEAEGFLLFDRSWFGVALRDDYTAQDGPIFAGNVLPSGLAFVAAEVDLAGFIAGLQENAPAIFGHADITKLGPAVGFNAGCSAEIDRVLAGFGGAHVGPPAEERWWRMFEGALQHSISAQVDIVGNFFGVIDHCGSPSLG